MDYSELFELSPQEKLQLVQDLWDDIAAHPENLPVHDWQKQLLDERRAKLEANPESAIPWDEVKRRVRAQHAG